MLIKSRMGISADGFVSTPEGVPALAMAPGFEPGISHGYPGSIEGCDAVVMGRTPFLPALGAPQWPWSGLQVYVLTSSPLPAGTPDHVTAGLKGPADLLGQLRSRPSGGDVHLVGGPQAIRAFCGLGAPDRLQLVVLPMLLGAGLPLSPQDARPAPLTLLRADRIFPDGSAEPVCQPA